VADSDRAIGLYDDDCRVCRFTVEVNSCLGGWDIPECVTPYAVDGICNDRYAGVPAPRLHPGTETTFHYERWLQWRYAGGCTSVV